MTYKDIKDESITFPVSERVLDIIDQMENNLKALRELLGVKKDIGIADRIKQLLEERKRNEKELLHLKSLKADRDGKT